MTIGFKGEMRTLAMSARPAAFRADSAGDCSTCLHCGLCDKGKKAEADAAEHRTVIVTDLDGAASTKGDSADKAREAMIARRHADSRAPRPTAERQPEAAHTDAAGPADEAESARRRMIASRGRR